MKKYVSIFIFVALALCIALVPTFLNGFSSKVYLPKEDTGYEITAYDVEIDVNVDGSFDVKESLDVHFYTGDTHGIYRWLPLVQSSSYRDKDGKVIKKNFRAKVSNVFYNVGESSNGTHIVDRFSENSNYFLQIGSLGFVPAGSDMKYTFSYNYDFGNDRDKTMDMLYYNIIGTGWDTKISNLTFRINFPKQVSSNGFEFYVGRYGESATNSNRVTSQFDEETMVLSGSVESLAYGEAVTVYKELEQGYFKYERGYIFDIAILAIFLLVILMAVVLFFRKRRKSPIVEVVEFKAPEDITSAEAGLINDGKLTGDDLSSLIVYWASKGFVKIKQEDGHVKIIKTAKSEDLEGKMKEHEKILFDDMFRGDIQFVDSKNLNLSQETGLKCKKSVENETKNCFDTKADRSYVVLLILTPIMFGLLAIKNIFQSVFTGVFLTLQILFTIMMIVGICLLPNLYKYKDKCKKKKFVLLLVLDLILIFAPMIAQMILSEAFVDAFGARFYISAIAIVLVCIYPFLERYTERGRDILGRIRGLKNFILVAEKDKLEMLVHDNPELFYEILPFAYVLGVSDVFMKKFEDVEIVQPSSNPTFFDRWVSFIIINDCLNAVTVSVERNISTALATKAGKVVGSFTSHIGGGSGGFSGGGHGGGGGGRW